MGFKANIFFDISEEGNNQASGDLIVFDRDGGYRRYPVLSGPYGKGPLPPGIYKVEKCYFMLDDGTVDAYKKEDRPWIATLKPLFETERTGFAIHPDGNVPGSKGCIAITKQDMSAKSQITALIEEDDVILKVV